MPQSLAEYAQWLAERNLRWPAPPKPEPVRAKPLRDPLPGIRVVLWNLYGTLIRISDGELRHEVPDELRMEVALDKTIREFNMWYSMTRKPGAPWEQLLTVYQRIIEDFQLTETRRKGDVPEVDSARVWRKVLERLCKKEYEYDQSQYGDLDELGEKIAYYFHSALQGHEAAPDAARTLTMLSQSGLHQGLLADGQCFSLTQLFRDLLDQDTATPVSELFRPELMVLSCKEGVRKPSLTLYAAMFRRLQSLGMEPSQVLYVTSRISGDLEVAKTVGFHTALYAGEKLGFSARAEEFQNPDTCPDRMLTRLDQIRDILGV